MINLLPLQKSLLKSDILIYTHYGYKKHYRPDTSGV